MDSPGVLAYTAAKHGVIGLMRSWANFLAPHLIRVNAVAPTTVATPMANMGDLGPQRHPRNGAGPGECDALGFRRA